MTRMNESEKAARAWFLGFMLPVGLMLIAASLWDWHIWVTQ